MKTIHKTSVGLESGFFRAEVIQLFERVQRQDQRHSLKVRDIAKTRIHNTRAQYKHLANTNMDTLFRSEEYSLAIEDSLLGQCTESHHLELEVHEHYHHWGEFLCDYESFRVLERNQNSLSPNSTIYPPRKEEYYQAELIDEVRDDQRQYLTPFTNHLLSLADSILLTNLCTLVKDQKWFEILFDLDRSNRGCHFIMFFLHGKYRYLVSTACIQAYKNKEEWLYLSNYFCRDEWRWNDFSKALEVLRRESNLNFNEYPKNFNDIVSKYFPSDFSACEIIRLTISGNRCNKLLLLYLSQVNLSRLLSLRFRFSFIITENKQMLNLYNSSPNMSYINIGDLADGKSIVFKGVIDLIKINEDLESINFKDFKSRTLRYKERV